MKSLRSFQSKYFGEINTNALVKQPLLTRPQKTELWWPDLLKRIRLSHICACIPRCRHTMSNFIRLTPILIYHFPRNRWPRSTVALREVKSIDARAGFLASITTVSTQPSSRFRQREIKLKIERKSPYDVLSGQCKTLSGMNQTNIIRCISTVQLLSSCKVLQRPAG